jgi:membrane-associated protein
MNFDLAHLQQPIQALGFWGGNALVWGIIFAESCFLFFLPGDSLLFTAGFLASQGLLNIWLLAIGSLIGAVLGNNVGYHLGHKFGRKLFRKEDSMLFHKDHLVKAQAFYERHGRKTIVLARFMPIIRTFAPIVAGIGTMHYQTFAVFNLAGGLLWTFGLTFLGFYLGQMIPDVDKYLLPIIGLIIVVSLVPSVFHFYQDHRSSRKARKH